MSISISDFKTWAGANQRTAVAVNNGALGSASNQIGILDRIFRRGTVDSVHCAWEIRNDQERAAANARRAELTAEQKGLFRAVALQGGNFEVQKMNVGVAGFMSGSVKSIKERLGGSEYHAFHRGGANHIA